MRLNFSFGIRFCFFILAAGIILFSSCRTTRSLPKAEVEPVAIAGLLNKIEQNAFDYEYFTVRRINCQYSGNGTKVSFNATMKAQKDKIILVSISKLSIPVGSAMLTPDSVKFVSYIDRSYFLDDYKYLSKILNVELDFEIIQSILSNNAFLYRSDAKDKDLIDFETLVEDGFYVLVSGKTEDKDASILQKMFFDPATFTLNRLFIDDKTNIRNLEFMFADFEKVKDKNYPGTIDMYFTSPEDQISLKLKMSGFSNEIIDSFTFSIPEKYEQIRIN